MKQTYPVNIRFVNQKTIFFRVLMACCLLVFVQTDAKATITGTLNVCTGATTTLSGGTTGGTWSSGNTAIATVGSASGVVTGVAAGTVNITYTPSAGGATFAEVTVNSIPVIAMQDSVCLNVAAGAIPVSGDASGSWDIPVNPGDGLAMWSFSGDTTYFAASFPGAYTLSFTDPAGCTAYHDLYVHMPPPGLVTTTYIISAGSTVSLFFPYYPWGSYDESVVTMSYTYPYGLMTGVAAGTTKIGLSAYDVSGTCALTETDSVVVTSSPEAAVAGPDSVSVGSSVIYYSSIGGGTWSSSSNDWWLSSSIDSATGMFTGIDAGTFTITYTVAPWVFAEKNVVVYDGGTVSGGTYSVCSGATYALPDTGSGTWGSSNTSVATVGSTGIVTGVTAGTAVITHTHTSPYSVWGTIVTVTPTPVITAVDSMAIMGAVTATASPAGGVWYSDSTVFPFSSYPYSEVPLYPIAIGTSTISYTLDGCTATHSVTVDGVHTDTAVAYYTIEVGDTMPLYWVTTDYGGVWYSSDDAIAKVDYIGTGLVGMSPGTVYVGRYIGTTEDNLLPLMWEDIRVTVVSSSTPGPITGNLSLCEGRVSKLAMATASGTWSSGNTSVATVGSLNGRVTGVGSGTAVITYTYHSSGFTTAVVTVNTPGTLSFPYEDGTTSGLFVCILHDIVALPSIPGGTWTMSSEALGVSTADSAVILHAQQLGVDVITYTVNGCAIPATTVNVRPGYASISSSIGPIYTCDSATITTESTSGYWFSNNRAVATVDSVTGVVKGIEPGNAIVYRCYPDCTITDGDSVTVIASPHIGVITGTTAICMGSTSSLSDTSGGGTWSSTNTSVATVSSTGVVTAVSPGTARISYVLSSSLYTTAIVTVSTAVSSVAIWGDIFVCWGGDGYLMGSVDGGVWTSSDTAKVRIYPDGVIIGVDTGSATVSYTIANGCGTVMATRLLTVNAAPFLGVTTGPSTICVGGTGTFSNTSIVAGSVGMWTSSNTSVASILGATVTGVALGTSTISYTQYNFCGSTSATKVVTVVASASAGTISGAGTICSGGTTTLSDATSGGVWSSGNTAVATAGSSSGVVTGVSAGTAAISYTVANGCGSTTVTWTETVSPAAAVGAITGTSTVCTGATTTLADTSSGGVWSSSNTAVAAVGSGSGVVTGVTSGTAIISYTVTNSCGAISATKTITVSAPISAGTISGETTLCSGTTTALTSSGSSGGVWSSSNTSVATVGSNSGVVTGVSAGTVTISYTVTNSCGSYVATMIETVNPAPVVTGITGVSLICPGTVIYLTDTSTGVFGTWTSSNTAVATAGASGIITGVTSGTATISFTIYNSCGSISATKIVTVSTTVSAGTITGSATMCAAAFAHLTDTTGGYGTWSSSNTGVATINSAGIMTGVSAGTVVISYTVSNSCGTAAATWTETVNPQPSPGIVGSLSSLCVGGTWTASSTGDPGGVWSSSNTSVATIGSSTGIVTAVGVGTYRITYTVTNSCNTLFSTSASLTVNPLPNAGTISGTASLCQATSVTLTSSGTSGGTWTSDHTTIASVGSSTGVVTGVSTGTATISYTITNSCGTNRATQVVTVNSGAGIITGTAIVCTSATTTLSDTVSGGIWSSGNTAIATVGSGTGVVSGVTTGTATISYTVTNSCGTNSAMRIVTIDASVSAGTISGTTTICPVGTTTVTSTVGGGVWSSSNTTVVLVGSGSGVVSPIWSGTSTISYTVTNGCGTAVATLVVTVVPGFSAGYISGTATVCTGGTTTLTETASGVWSSTNTAVATISSSGVVTGVGPGTTTISYTVTGICSTIAATRVVTVNAGSTIGSISGASTVCAGSTMALSDTTSGGTWSSSNTAIATVGSSSGVVTGIAGGTATISYTATNSCGVLSVTKAITVNAVSAGSISGPASVCMDHTITLTDVTGGGSWSSSNAAVATVGSSSGVVTGVTAGTATISYTVTNSCGTATATQVVTVNALPDAGTIIGGTSVSTGSTLTLTDGVSGGIWSASNTHATVSSSGVVTGVSAGSVIISYTVTNGCGSAVATKTVNVTSSGTGITGSLQVCAGSTTTLGYATGGGTWSSSASVAIFTIGASTGVVTGVAAGTGIVTYTVGGSPVTAVVTVNALPANISGAASVCLNAATTLTDATAGGTWGSNNTLIATAGVAGTIAGVATGTTTITYTLSTGCYKTQPMTVKPLPVAITGPASICAGSSATYTDATTGGMSWMSSTGSVATIGSLSGALAAVSAGTTTITYTLSTGCYITKIVSVIAAPGAITGTATVCAGSTTPLGNAITGGTWASGTTSVATVDATTGVVTGVAAGASNVTYTAGGCSSAKAVTVNPMPAVITGGLALCTASTSTLSSSTGGGTWNSSATAVATVSSAGLVTATGTGNATISYTLGTGCMRTAQVTVSAAPSVTSASTLCVGSSATFVPSVTGGTWSSSSATIASANVTTGVVTGVAAGTANITYALSASCKAINPVTVNASLPAISGAATVCNGSTTTLSDAATGGTWSSSNTAVAAVAASTGVVSGVSTGSAIITYATSGGCHQTKSITVGNTLGSITGATGLCVGSTTTYLSASPTTGVGWSSSNTSVASVGAASGVVTGVAAGTAIITFTPYSFSTYAGCVAVKTVTVDAVPSVAAITGPSSVQVGHTITLADVTGGGIWSSNNTARATVSAGGVVTGVSVPAVTISYSMANGACIYSVSRLITITAARPEAPLQATAAAISVYPNPTSGIFTVSTSEAGTFVIYTIDGKEVEHMAIVAGLNQLGLPKDLAAGIYMCRFMGESGSSMMVRLVYE